jgi:hypothetical protein
VAALGVEVHFRGDSGLLQSHVVRERLLDRVDRVILRLDQEGWRRIGADADVGAKAEILLPAGGAAFVLVNPQVAGICGDGEVRAAAQRVGGVDRR